jgi:hypothetical protein
MRVGFLLCLEVADYLMEKLIINQIVLFGGPLQLKIMRHGIDILIEKARRFSDNILIKNMV